MHKTLVLIFINVYFAGFYTKLYKKAFIYSNNGKYNWIEWHLLLKILVKRGKFDGKIKLTITAACATFYN